jgi:hypothetical protein
VVSGYNGDEPLYFIKAGTCLVLNKILTHGVSLREGFSNNLPVLRVENFMEEPRIGMLKGRDLRQAVKCPPSITC